MNSLDYIIIIAYVTGVFCIGLICAFGHKSLAGYFLGGRNVPWWAAACSGIAAIVSGIAYLGAPGLAFTHNYTYHQMRLGIPLALIVICVVMLPIFFRLNICSIYEYLERRFDRRVRLLASALFLLSKCGYLAIVIYAPSLVVSRALGLPLPAVVFATGMIVAVYTMLGGIKAVIWTDTIQLGIFVAGILVTLAIVISRVPGGLGGVIQTADAAGRLELIDWSFSLTETYTIWGGLIGGSFLLISQFGSNQAEIQRFLATKSARQANWAMSSSMILSIAVGICLFFIGTALFGFYHAFPEKGGMAMDPNQIFAKFIIEEIPGGLRGLLIAAVLSASMSTISVMLNSLTTVTSVDIIPLWTKRASTVKEARIMTLVYGALITILAGFGAHLGNILEASIRVMGLLLGSITGVFLIGMLSRRVTATAGFYGMIAGMVMVIVINFGFPEVSFLWHSPASAITTMLVSRLLSLGVSEEKIKTVSPELLYQRKSKRAGKHG
jgi:SSS family transporter